MLHIEDALFQLIEKGQSVGHFNQKHSPRAMARFVFNAISGLRVASKSGTDKKVFDDIVMVTISAIKN